MRFSPPLTVLAQCELLLLEQTSRSLGANRQGEKRRLEFQSSCKRRRNTSRGSTTDLQRSDDTVRTSRYHYAARAGWLMVRV